MIPDFLAERPAPTRRACGKEMAAAAAIAFGVGAVASYNTLAVSANSPEALRIASQDDRDEARARRAVVAMFQQMSVGIDDLLAIAKKDTPAGEQARIALKRIVERLR